MATWLPAHSVSCDLPGKAALGLALPPEKNLQFAKTPCENIAGCFCEKKKGSKAFLIFFENMRFRAPAVNSRARPSVNFN